MNRFVFLIIVVLSLIGCSQPADAPPEAEPATQAAEPTPQTPEEAMIAEALSAAPAAIAANATVMDWENNVLQEGTNGWVCMPSNPILPGVAPMCLDEQWQQWGVAWNNKTEVNTTAVGLAYMLQGDAGASNTDPYAQAATADNEWVVTGPHVMVIVPDPAMLEGIPSSPSGGGPYVMWRDTPYVHVMVPVEE